MLQCGACAMEARPGALSLMEDRILASGFWVVIAIVAAVIVYVMAKVLVYARRSEQQWSEVDKSKLKEWDDDEW